MRLSKWLELLALRDDETILDRLLAMSPADRQHLLREIPRRYLQELDERWYQWAHKGQYEPPGDWPVWLIRAGRGFGKTRAGSEWISEMARRMPGERASRRYGRGGDVAVPLPTATPQGGSYRQLSTPFSPFGAVRDAMAASDRKRPDPASSPSNETCGSFDLIRGSA